VELSKNELHILRYFFEHKGEVVSREDLMNDLWDNESFVDDNTLSVNIGRLRKKLEDIFQLDDFIHTKKGMGYYI
jgi:DNA-binding response OmpR family regulator